MDDFYVESFFKNRNRDEAQKNAEKTTSAAILETQPLAENYELSNQMLYYMDQLEATIASEWSDPSDFRFIFTKIREGIRLKKMELVLSLLDELEELLDLSLEFSL